MSVRVRVRVSQVRLRALEGRRACPRVACASACAAPKYPGGVTRNTLNFPYPVGLQKTRYNLPERPALALRQRSDSTQAERDTKAAVKAHGTRRAAIAAILLGGLHLRLELPVALAELGQLLAQLGVISLVRVRVRVRVKVRVRVRVRVKVRVRVRVRVRARVRPWRRRARRPLARCPPSCRCCGAWA